MITEIESRLLLPCECDCGRKAPLAHFRFIFRENGSVIRYRVLPAHEAEFRERLATMQQLKEIVTRHRTPLERLRWVLTVYRMQRRIHAHKGARAARQTARRSAIVYFLGTRFGLWVSNLWLP